MVPSRQKGRFAIVTGVGRDAVDVTVHQTNAPATYGKAMWSCRPDAGVKLATMLRIAPMTETTKPGLRGEPGISRQPSRGECRAFPATCGDLLVCFFVSHARLRARPAPGIPCALLSTEGANIAGSTRANSQRDRVDVAFGWKAAV